MNPVVALVGAETALGEVIIELFAKRGFPGERLIPLVNDIAEVGLISFGEGNLRPQDLDDFDFSRAGVTLIADPNSSPGWIEGIRAAGSVVVHCYGLPADHKELTPPIVAGVNSESLEAEAGLSVNSAAVAAQFLASLLKPLSELGEIQRVSVTSLYPAVFQGQGGIEELAGQTARLLNGVKPEPKVFNKQIAFNISPEVAKSGEAGTGEEALRVAEQIKKILHRSSLSVQMTCIQVAVFYALSQVVEIEFAEPVSSESVNNRLKKVPGIKLNSKGGGMSAVEDKFDTDVLHVSPIPPAANQGENSRQITLWCIGDYLRRGLGLNAVQIAEILIKGYL